VTPKEMDEEERELDALAELVRTSRAELAVRRVLLERARLEAKKAEWRAALRKTAEGDTGPRAFKERD
jgi:hypothetical protein